MKNILSSPFLGLVRSVYARRIAPHTITMWNRSYGTVKHHFPALRTLGTGSLLAGAFILFSKPQDALLEVVSKPEIDCSSKSEPICPMSYYYFWKCRKPDMDVNLKDVDGRTALFYAAESGNIEAVRGLLHDGADPNIKDMNHNAALHIAAEKGDSEMVRVLYEGGANLDATTWGGHTAVHQAITYHQVETLSTLIELGADLRRSSSDKICTFSALDLAAWIGEVDAMNVLFEAGVGPNDSDGKSLIYAVQHCNLEAVRLLLAKGAKLEQKVECKDVGYHEESFQYITPLGVAVMCGHLEVVKDLLKHGSQLTTPEGCDSLIGMAVTNGHREMVRYLLSLGGNVKEI